MKPLSTAEDPDDWFFNSFNNLGKQADPPPPTGAFDMAGDSGDWSPPVPDEIQVLVHDDLARMPEILTRSLNATLTSGWRYNPRSDRHSVIKCFGLLLDLLRSVPLLGPALQRGELVFGINSPFDGKALDLVLGPPTIGKSRRRLRSLYEIVENSGIQLDVVERERFQLFEGIQEGVVKTPLVAVEAKAVMTDHGGALPRLTDELERFRSRFNPEITFTMGLVLVNTATEFVSPGRNAYNAMAPHKVTSFHQQPHASEHVITALQGISLRTGMVFVDCQNNDQPISLRDLGPEHMTYGALVRWLSARLIEQIKPKRTAWEHVLGEKDL